MTKTKLKELKLKLKKSGYEQTHSTMSDDENQSGIYFLNAGTRSIARIFKGKIYYTVGG